jgi:gliding motility-associated-like protein
MMKRLAILAAVIFFGIGVHAQAITINNANFNTGSYGVGGNISVPITITGGCFDQNNTFQLYLSDAAGNFSPGTLIGSYNSFFTPFVNGVIPNGTGPGAGYKVRVISTSPAGITATSNAFTIVSTGSSILVNPTTAPNNTINDTTFGKCLFTTSSILNLAVTVPGGTTMSAVVLDKNFSNVAATVNPTSISFTMSPGNYYTVQVTIKNNGDNSQSIKSYLILASTNNLNFQTSGSNEICLPDTARYIINTAGIANNYPGTLYSIDWGDGVTTTLTHCQLLAAGGNVSHAYTTTSCGRAPITDIIPNQYNAYKVNLTAANQFCASSFYTPITSYAKVWSRPLADFTNPQFGCLNTPITFTNVSQAGLSGYNNAQNCSNSSSYEWYIDGGFVSSATNLVYSFSTTGNHTIQLVAINDPCNDDTTMVICIEPTPNPNFKLNGADVLAGCTGLVADVSNTSSLTNGCRPYTFNWTVVKVPGPAVLNTDYTYTPNPTDSTPRFTFLTPGTYYIRLTVSNSCGIFFDEDTVIIKLNADVTLPASQSYCGLQTINFGTNPAHTPSYNTNAGTEVFLWTITPNTFSFVGGTSATNAYPQVQFNAYGTYDIKVKFTNDCGVDSAVQQILFFQPVTANAGTDQNVCFTVNSVNLSGSSTGPAGYTFNWTIVPGFGNIANLSSTVALNPTYTFSASDKTNGSVRLVLNAFPPGGSVCTVVRDTVVITIYPDNSITSAATASICSGSNLNYTITANLPASTFTWTSGVISGAATGNTASGNTALINDILTNSSNSVNAVVRYVITPVANGCNGNVFNLDVTVKALPQFTPTPSATTLCSGDQLTINLASALGGAQYTWSSSVGSGTATGNTNQASPTATGSIVNTLTNTGTTDATITYTIIVYNAGTPTCTGETEQVVVTVRPPVNASASGNSPVCTGQTINLAGNSTTAGATYAWTGPNGFNNNTQNPTINNAIPANAGVYTLIVTANGCPSPAANTTVVVNPSPVIGGSSGINPTSCATATGSITLTGLANNTTYTVNYTFNGNPATPVSLNTNGSGSLIIPNLAAGIYDNITVTLNTCTSNPVGAIALSDPSAPNTPSAGSNSPICAGTTLNLTASTTTPGTPAYAWSGPNGFSSNQQNPGILNATTAATGTYNVVVTISNCTSAAGSVSVVVNATPVTPTAGSNSPICTGATLNLTSTTPTGGVTYAWTGPNTFTSTAQNPTINNVTAADAGPYSVTATIGSCISAAGTTTVVINPTPNISSTSTTNPTSCASATGSITLNGLANNTTYTVNYDFNGSPATPATIASNGSGSLVIPNLVAGIYNNIRVTVNGCTSNIAGPFTLSDPTPPATPTASSNSPVCSGLALNLTASTTTPGVATYTWSGPNAFTSNTQNPSIPNVTTAATGTYNVTVTISGCTSAAGSTGVTINQTPVTPVAGSNTPVCSGNTLNLTASTSTPGVMTWAWNGPNTFTSNSQNPNITNVTTAATGTYTVIATLGSCTSASGSTNVIVNPTPVIGGSGANNPASCATATGSIVLTGLGVSTAYTVYYTQNGTPQTATISTNGSGNLIIPNLPAGSYTNVYVELNNCPSNIAGPFTLSDPTPPGVPLAGNNGPTCSGNNLLLTANSATPGVTYTWNGPNGFSSNVQNPTIPNASTAATGSYNVTATLNGCTSAAGTTSVTVNQTPVAPTAGSNSPVCTTGTLNLTASTPSAGVTYAWTGPNGFSNSNQNPTISNVTLADAGLYSVIVTSTAGNCPSAAGTTTVVINPTPNISGNILNNPTSCATSTGSIVLQGLAASTAYTVNYTQNGTPNSVGLSSDGSGNITIPNLPAGSYTNISVALNGCSSNIVGPFTLSDPTPPAVPVTGSNSPICSGNTLNLTANSATPGVTYTWSGPNGFASNVQNPSITNAPVAATGIYSVTATLNSCTSAAGTVSVTVNPTPATPTAGSNSPVCSGGILTLTSNTSSPGVTYAWTGPNGFSNATQNPTINNVTLANAGVYSVIATTTVGNCPSAAGTTTVAINPTPNISGSSSTNPTNCASSTGTITLTGLAPNTTFTVNYTQGVTPQTATLGTDATGALVIPNLPAGTYSNISVTLNNCPSNIVGPFTLADPTPPATPIAGNNGPVCSGNTLNLTASTTSPGTATYAWTGPNGFTNNTQNPSITNVTVAASGIYSVSVTINSCTSATGTTTVVVNQTPATPVALSNTPVCTDSTLNLTASTTTPGAMTWSWTGPNGFSSLVQNPTVPNITLPAAGTYTVIATATTGNCPSAQGSTSVVINPTPVITTTSFTNPSNCNTATGSITLNGLAASTAYSILYNFNGNPQTANLSSGAGGSLVIPNLISGTYSNIRVVLTGCPSNIVGPVTLTDPNPPATPTAGSNSPICSGNNLNLTASTTSVGAITYTWSGPNGFSSIQQNPTIAAATLAANGTYSVTATLNSCVSAPGTVSVTVNETPATPVTGNNSPICADSTLNLTASTTFAGSVSWSWTGPNGFTNSSQNPSIIGATLAANGVYSVVATATTGSCPSAAGTTTVVINPTPVISSASFTNPTQCLSSTGTIVLNGLAVSTAYTVTYTQNGNPATATITSNASGVVTIPNLPAGTYANIRVTTTAGCPSNTVGPFTLTDPNPPAQPTVGSNSPICTGETLNLTASTSTPGVITYSWTGPAGFTSNLQNPTIINATPGNSGTYTITATLNNCVSPSNSVLVDVVALPAAPAVSSPVTYCVNTPSVPLTATPLPGNSLRWYTTSVGGAGSVSAPTPSTGTVGVTNYYVSQVTPLGCEGVRALIEVVVNPDALAEFTYSPSTDCAPFNITSSVIQPILHPLQNSIYQWYANGVLIGTGTTFPGYTILNAGDSVFIRLKTISLYGCKNDSAGAWFYTPPKPITNFTASDTVGCGPLSVTFTNTTPLIGAFSYNWNFGNGITSTAVNPGTIIFQPNPTAGDTIYHVSLTAFTQCDTVTKVVDIRVKSKPKAIITPDKTYGCSPLTVTFANISLGVNMTYEWNFGDGSASFFTNNNSPVQHTFNTGQQDTFYVRLIATNECGSDTGYYNVVVAAATIDLDVAHNGNQQTGCAPHTVTFFNHSTGATNFIWDFGDGNLLTTTNNIDTIVHTFQSVGTFNVFIRASNGCTDTTITENISVFARPNVNFTYAPAPVCVGDTIYFTNQSDTITGLLWTFDDGTTSQLTNPVHAYSAAGTYNVQLIGIRQYAPGNACTDTIVYPVTVVSSLPGLFTANVSGTCLPVTVTFTNHSLPSALTTWNFGNGAVDTGDVVTYTYTQVGTYTVTMTARDLNGCLYTHTMQINTTGPTGSFIYDHNYICGATPVRFDANVINTDSIRWNFGDGSTIITSTGSIIYHVYNQSGIYVPTATLLGGGGTCSRLLTGIDTIKVDYVSAGFTANQTRSCGSTLIAFTDTSRSYFGVNAWEWTFGDGGASNIKNPVHPYTTTNTWPIRLIATSASGCKDTTDVPLFIKVDALPAASIVHPPTGCVNSPVTYNSVVISQDPVTYYSWTFSNLATGNTPTVQNNYAAAGVYTAQLIAGTSFGCYDTVTSNITINPSPFVNTNPDMQICRGQSAHLNVTGGLTYTWAPFTGLSCTTCQDPIASPLTTTQYVVTGYNSFGCAGRDTILITVPQPIDVVATPPVTLCIGQSINLNATGANTYVWSPATGLSATNIPNPTANPTVTTIYRVIGFDAHNCFQDTAYVPVGVGNYPVVNVGRDTILATGSPLTLTPTATQGPIGLWSWNPSTDLSCANCPNPVAIAKKDICYTVTATNLFGCSGKDTMCIKVFCEGSQVFIPNAFTPDADGINDMLTVKGKGIKTVKIFRIFNRWGQLVFEKSNFQPNIDSYGWNGRVNGIPAPPDVYVYTCEVVCEDDTPYTYKGNVAILK